MKRIFSLFSAVLPLVLVLAPAFPAFAEIQIEITDNGSGTENSVTVANDRETTVSQSNTADVIQSVNQETDTGSNSATGSSGNTQITTGDAASQTEVNSGLNSATVASDCCGDNEINITVSGNGENSINTIHTQLATTTTINIHQEADIENSLGISANSGRNQVNDNGGSVQIATGDINSRGKLANPANITSLTVGQGAWDITIIARDNGKDSTNVIFLDYMSDLLLWRNEYADIGSRIYADLNTGGNLVLGNLNDTLLDTGNIDFSFSTFNGPINTGSTDIICCDDGTPVDPPQGGDDRNTQPGTPPPSTPGPNTDHNGSRSNGGQVLGALTDILPLTGASALHFWILAVVYLITFLAGLYVRLRAGNSPNLACVRPVGRPCKFRGYLLLTY